MAINLEPVTITIRGPHDTGRTTLANLWKMFLDENGFRDVKVEDTEPLPNEQKDPWPHRFARNRERPIRIFIELAGESERDHEREACAKLVEKTAHEVQRSAASADRRDEMYRRAEVLKNLAYAIRHRDEL